MFCYRRLIYIIIIIIIIIIIVFEPTEARKCWIHGGLHGRIQMVEAGFPIPVSGTILRPTRQRELEKNYCGCSKSPAFCGIASSENTVIAKPSCDLFNFLFQLPIPLLLFALYALSGCYLLSWIIVSILEVHTESTPYTPGLPV